MPAAQSTMELRTDALVAPTRRRSVREFYRGFAAQHPSVRSRFDPTRRIVAGVGIAAGVIGVSAMVFGITEEIRESSGDAVGQVVGLLGVLTLLVIGAVALTWWYVRSRLRRGTPTRHYRLAHYAADNGMSYQPGPYRGSHLLPWADRGRLIVTGVMRPFTGRQVEFANFELAYGESARRNTQFGGYCSIRLRTRLPHIVLQSTRNAASRLSSMAIPIRAQRLSLEGDFDSHFSLYCPEGYERDALYLFTPDVMARLIDSVNGFDVELIDDWLFLTRTADVVTLDPRTWQGIVAATNALGDKIGRWERWREDRPIDDPGAAVNSIAVGHGGHVDGEGRRLRMTVGRGVILWTLVGAAFFAALVLTNVFD